MIKLDKETLPWLVAGGLALWLVGGKLARGISEGIAQTAGDIVVGVGTGTVIGVAKSLGIPETNADQCQAALAEGRYWDASFYCPAGTFLRAATGAIFDTSSGEQVGQAEATGSPEIVRIEPVTQSPFDPFVAPGYTVPDYSDISQWGGA